MITKKKKIPERITGLDRFGAGRQIMRILWRLNTAISGASPENRIL
jgi:hypothetical protein